MLEGLSLSLEAIVPFVLEMLAGVVLILAAWALKRFATKMGVESDEKVRKYLIDTIQAGVAYGKNKVEEELGDTDVTKADVKNVMLAHAASYVMTRVPDAVKKFKLTEQDIRDLVLAHLEEK